MSVTNLTTAIFLINPNARAMLCEYDSGSQVVFKTLDPSIKVDDIVVVPTKTRCEHTTVKVIEADYVLDVTSDVPIEWIVDVVDVKKHAKILEQEGLFLAAANRAEKEAQMKELRDKLFPNGIGEVETLKIASMGSKSDKK